MLNFYFYSIFNFLMAEFIISDSFSHSQEFFMCSFKSNYKFIYLKPHSHQTKLKCVFLGVFLDRFLF